MKQIFLVVVLINSIFKGYAQGHFDFGVQNNLVQKTAEFNNLKSYTLHSGLAYELTTFIPVYFGANLDYFLAIDKLIISNTLQSAYLGGNFGFRPFAKKWVKPIQPFVETNFNFPIGDSLQPIKKIMNYGVGLELYFARKSAMTVNYFNEYYLFDKERLMNSSIKVGLRFAFFSN